ncbi:efflux RND transporter periplasmic adaptor subunit [Nitrospirillum amazonense]|uniref:efflux RND transporter periplasmic adaptor subunit n=1 Tax=Nitrospirillum amazonense TaxID=28077 RepID=UPI002412AFF6|nr:efflux RND transporter periplasmic adaptor subunit [Nitrospirillum amazonense]MDG3439149.1 efflux RND transporter periplasmic adaptor subunit [Nitrospirillum amazonense]
MSTPRIGYLAGTAVGLVLAAAVGFGVARMTAPAPAAAPAATPTAAKTAAPAESQSVPMTEEQIKVSEIQVQPAAAGGIEAETITTATVAATPDGLAVLTAHAPGTITRIHKRIGEAVRAGDVVAEVEGREVATLAADRAAAQAKATQARQQAAREKSLFDQGVSPRQDLEAAQAAAEAAEAELRRAIASAGAARLASDGRSIQVVSPIDGRVTIVSASLGAYVQVESELFRVADPARTQIEATVPADAASRLRSGDRATITTGDGRTLDAHVLSLTPGVNRETLQATALLALDQPAEGLLPGQYVRATLFTAKETAGDRVTVPTIAVQTIAGREVVFLRTKEGFTAQPVTLARRSGDLVELSGGLKAGQRIATINSFLLKAELGKAEVEE